MPVQDQNPRSDRQGNFPYRTDKTGDRMADRTLIMCTFLVFASVLLFAGAGLLYLYTDDARNTPSAYPPQKNHENMNQPGPGLAGAPSDNQPGWQEPVHPPVGDGDRHQRTGCSHETKSRNEPGSMHGDRLHGPMKSGDDGYQKRSDIQSSPGTVRSGPILGKAPGGQPPWN